MFVAAVAQGADLLQATANLCTGGAVHLRQAQAQRPVGVTELKTLDQVRAREAASLQVRQRFGRLLQRLALVTDGRTLFWR